MEDHLRVTLSPSKRWCSDGLRGFKGALHWAPMMPGNASLSDSHTSDRCGFFQSRNTLWRDAILGKWFCTRAFEFFFLCNTEKKFRNFVKSNRNQIVFTTSRSIWNKIEFSFVPIQSEMCCFGTAIIAHSRNDSNSPNCVRSFESGYEITAYFVMFFMNELYMSTKLRFFENLHIWSQSLRVSKAKEVPVTYKCPKRGSNCSWIFKKIEIKFYVGISSLDYSFKNKLSKKLKSFDTLIFLKN